MLDLLLDHVEIIAKSSQVGFKLDVSDVFDAPVDAPPLAHDFQELQMRLLPSVLVDTPAKAFHSLLVEGELFAKHFALDGQFLSFVLHAIWNANQVHFEILNGKNIGLLNLGEHV